MQQINHPDCPIPTVQNWEYPQLSVDLSQFPDKSHEDLPDAMRWADAIAKEPAWSTLKGKELEDFIENWKYCKPSIFYF